MKKEYTLKKEGDCFSFVPDSIEAETTYTVKAKAELKGKEGEWSVGVEFTTPKFSECCAWKECPDKLDGIRSILLNEMNPRIATKINDDDYCTITGNTPLPQNKVTSWSIKILKSKYNDGRGIYIGVAPSDISQNEYDNYDKCGWYFYCYNSILWSGPPHNYREKEYGPRKCFGKYIHTGDSVGVVMDTAKGKLSFVVNGVSLGVAYEGIPLDKHFVPCTILGDRGDSVELII